MEAQNSVDATWLRWDLSIEENGLGLWTVVNVCGCMSSASSNQVHWVNGAWYGLEGRSDLCSGKFQ